MATPFLSEIKMISWNFPPKGWAFCNGQSLPINQNQALFSLMGTTYGGNGQTTFALPNLMGRVPVHSTQQGQTGGEETHVLTLAELPTHTHGVSALNSSPTFNRPGNGEALAQGTTQIYHTPETITPLRPESVTATGGSQPHSNLQPSLVINFVVALNGAFPSRT